MQCSAEVLNDGDVPPVGAFMVAFRGNAVAILAGVSRHGLVTKLCACGRGIQEPHWYETQAFIPSKKEHGSFGRMGVGDQVYSTRIPNPLLGIPELRTTTNHLFGPEIGDCGTTQKGEMLLRIVHIWSLQRTYEAIHFLWPFFKLILVP